MSRLLVTSDPITTRLYLGRRSIHEDRICTDCCSDVGFYFHANSRCSMRLSADGVVLLAGCDHCVLCSDHNVLRSDCRLLRSDDCLLRSDHSLLGSDHCLLRSDDCLLPCDDCLLRSNHRLLRADHCLLRNFGVLRPNHGILRGQWLLRRWLLRRLLSRRIVRHWRGRLGRFSWNRPKVGSSRVVNGEDVAARSLCGSSEGPAPWLACAIDYRIQPVIALAKAALTLIKAGFSAATNCVFCICRVSKRASDSRR